MNASAARARHVGISEIARRMDDRFDLLTAGPRTAVTRQRTLRAVVEWSYALLGELERELFTRLCVFEGGFTLRAAQAVDPGSHAAWTLELLGGLVDKSLVIAGPVDPSDGETRYRIFRLYLAGSAAGFASGRVSVHQLLLSRADNRGTRLPLTRNRRQSVANR